MVTLPPLLDPPPPPPPEELQPAAASAATTAPTAMKRQRRLTPRGLSPPWYGHFAVIWSLLIPDRVVLPMRQRTRNSPELMAAGKRRPHPLTEPTVSPDAM